MKRRNNKRHTNVVRMQSVFPADLMKEIPDGWRDIIGSLIETARMLQESHELEHDNTLSLYQTVLSYCRNINTPQVQLARKIINQIQNAHLN